MKRGAWSWRCGLLLKNHSPVMPLSDSIHDLRETSRTICVGEKAIVRMYAMCLLKRSLRNPALLIKGRSGLILKESAHATDVGYRRLALRSGRRFMNNLSEHGFSSHSSHPSVILHRVGSAPTTSRDANFHAQVYVYRRAVTSATSNPPSSTRIAQPSCITT